MSKGDLVVYQTKMAVIVKTGQELVTVGFDDPDHLGLWFGEVTDTDEPIVHTIPAVYVEAQPQPRTIRYLH
jgi:hypothetical protein